MKTFRIIIGRFLFFIGTISSDPGDLIGFNNQNTLSISTIQFIVNSLGNNLPLPIYPISIYDIKYESHRPDGTIDTLSGLVSIPQEPLKAFPILSYQHGTILLDDAAPSIAGMTIDNLEVLMVGLISTPSGFITIFPDYEGIGNPDKYHPYIIADSYTRSVVNMIRAVKHLSYELQNVDKFQYNDQLFLIGYSEGGYATLAAQRGIQLNYSEELHITASFPMAGPYDLSGTMIDYFLSIPFYPSPYYVPYVLTSHLWNYQGLNVEFNDYFDPFWADTLSSLYDGTHSGSEVNNLMPDNPLDILLPDVLQEFIDDEEHFFRQTLNENTLFNWVPESPTYFYHGIGDDIIPYENAQIAHDTFVNNGASEINLVLYPEEMGGHSEVSFVCIFAGYDVILDYQKINPKGDLDSDGLITLLDCEQLSSIMINNDEISDFQFWAGDFDFDLVHSVMDLLMLIDNIE